MKSGGSKSPSDPTPVPYKTDPAKGQQAQAKAAGLTGMTQALGADKTRLGQAKPNSKGSMGTTLG